MPRFRVLLLCSFIMALAVTAKPKPITKRGLLDALKIGGLTTTELVRKIKERGVNFAVTPAIEDELRKAGAAPEVIQAARDNYRGNSHENQKTASARRELQHVFTERIQAVGNAIRLDVYQRVPFRGRSNGVGQSVMILA